MKKCTLFMALIAMLIAPELKAVDFAYEAGAEIVSAYLWRGQYNGGLSIQPDLEVGFDAKDGAIEFRGGVWGNIGASDWMFKKDAGDGSGYTKFMPELDVMLRFTAYGASVGFTHYYYCDGSNFFSWKKDADLIEFDELGDPFVNTTSTTELWVGYNFGHFFDQGAYINWYTTIAGNDFVGVEDGNPRRAWSTYIELGYDYTWEKIGLTLGGQLGMSPWASDLYGNGKFAVTNISLKLNKEWEFDAVTLDLFAQGMLNPDGINKQNAYINAAGDDKLYLQKLNGCIGLGVWF